MNRKERYWAEIREIDEVIKRLECRREELYNYIDQIEESEYQMRPTFWSKFKRKGKTDES